jgi:hypothetical protein
MEQMKNVGKTEVNRVLERLCVGAVIILKWILNCEIVDWIACSEEFL